ncbi:MAG: Holliday junction resolvase RuvX [Gammaproteobacteria bacterium]|nr:Holliday junction resolvase RuvX [Gammaproteobacteria bacterium]MDE0226737.1 Holliday junction resolvase RuvX [Gammaproteobacteria bacterium]MDE0452206.1 Holliday junction resolvase RuvX [Gammaproteobacteria bacterium]
MPHLAFDFGLKYIGVAVAEPRHGTATALSTVRARDGIPVWDPLDALVRQWEPEGLIVGLPLNMDDSESDMSNAARRFGVRLERRYGIDVEFVDERLSTFEAVQRGGSHDTAALIIAETWLNSQAT